MERFHCFDYYSSPILEGCFCFVLHINGYTDSLLGAPTVILNKVTCGYISNEWATPFFYNSVLLLSCCSSGTSKLPAEHFEQYEARGIWAKANLCHYTWRQILQAACLQNKLGSWKRLTCCIYGWFENDDLRVEWDNKAAQVTKPHTNLFLPTANP